MYDFNDLITKSLSERNIAHFYLYQYNIFGYASNSMAIFSRKVFFTELINTLELFINDSHCNDDHLKKNYSMIEFEPDFIDYEKQLMKKQQEYYNESGLNLIVKPLDWENCSDAKTLTEAFQNGLSLKEPVKFITINNNSTVRTYVIRKSKLEYLKSEAIRARDAKSIEELDVEINKKKQPKEDVISENDLNNVEGFVRKHFQFTLDIVERKKKAMLSEEDYLKLVDWVTYFFKNNYKLPHIETPIMEVNIGKTKMKTAFNKLIQLYHPSKPKPLKFYELVSMSFYVFKDETRDSIQKTSDPDKPVN